MTGNNLNEILIGIQSCLRNKFLIKVEFGRKLNYEDLYLFLFELFF